MAGIIPIRLQHVKSGRISVQDIIRIGCTAVKGMPETNFSRTILAPTPLRQRKRVLFLLPRTQVAAGLKDG
jgi:hypothetical protein